MSSAYDERRDRAYQSAWDQAWRRLPVGKLGDIAVRTGSSFDGRTFRLKVLDASASIDVVEQVVVCDLPEHDRFLGIVMLHYLIEDHDLQRSSDWLLFRQLPGGEAFQAAFQDRVVQRIARCFADRPRDLARTGRALGGKEERFGSATVVLDFLPQLPVRVTVWQGNEEVPGNATMLFPAHASRLLPTEDLAEVGVVVLRALERADRSSTDR